MSNHNRKIITDSSKIFIANGITSLFGFFRGIIVAGVLSPALFGIWNLFNVIISYSPHIHLGLLDGMTKLIPRLKGKGETESIIQIRDTAFSIVLLSILLIPVIMITGSYFFQDQFSREVIIGFRILSCLIAVYEIYVFLTAYIRVDDRFGLLSIALGSLAVLVFVLIILSFKIFNNKLYAALIGVSTAYIIVNMIILFATRYKFQFKIDWISCKKMIQIGLPIAVINISGIVFLSIDRWIVAAFLDKVNLGFYGFAFTICNFLFLLPLSITFTLYTRMLHQFGKTNDPKTSKNLLYYPALTISYMMAFICIAVALIMPLFIQILLPAYSQGLSVIIVLILAGFFMSLVSLFATFLISVDKQRNVLMMQIIVICFNALINIILIKSGYGILGVAFGTGFSYFIYTTLIIFIALKSTVNQIKVVFNNIIELYFPYIIMLLLYLVFQFVFQWNTIKINSNKYLYVLIFQYIIIIFTGFLLTWRLNWKMDLFTYIKDIIKNKDKK